MQPNKARADLWMDLALVAFLIGFDVAARLLPHVPGLWPFAASALFAGRMLRIPALAVIVPLAFSAGANLGRSGTALSLVASAAYAGSVAGPGLIGNVADHLGLRLALGVPLGASLLVAMLATGLRPGQSVQPI